MAEYNQVYYAKNREKIKAQTKKWAKDNPEKSHASKLSWSRLNQRTHRKPTPPDKRREYNRIAREELQPHYIARIIKQRTGLSTSVIKQYPELMESTATAIFIQRAIKSTQPQP